MMYCAKCGSTAIHKIVDLCVSREYDQYDDGTWEDVTEPIDPLEIVNEPADYKCLECGHDEVAES